MSGPARCPEIVLQPVVELRTGRIVGVEALSRFPGPDGPDVVLAQAAREGRGVAQERLALQAALAVLPLLPRDVTVAVNLSPAAVLDAGVREDVLAGCPSRTVVELTEHEVVDDYPVLLASLAELRAHGVRLAVDDTGAGYASLRHVLLLQPEIVKLDRCLVAGVAACRERAALVHGLSAMCRTTGAELVAEGVEDPTEVVALLDLGVTCGQGFYLGRPAAVELVAAAAARVPELPAGFTALLEPRRPSDLRARLAGARRQAGELQARSDTAARASARLLGDTRAALRRVVPAAWSSPARADEPAAAPRG